MPIKYVSPDAIYDTVKIIKTNASGQATEIKKVYRNNVVVWSKKSSYTPEQLEKMATQLAYLMNEERAALGVRKLYAVPYLNECAEIRAKEQLEKEGHFRPNGDYFSELIDTDKLDWLGIAENIALGTTSAEETVQYWKNSSSHWLSATNRNYTHTGVALYYDENSEHKLHWVQIFTNDMEPYAVYPNQYLPQNQEEL